MLLGIYALLAIVSGSSRVAAICALLLLLVERFTRTRHAILGFRQHVTEFHRNALCMVGLFCLAIYVFRPLIGSVIPHGADHSVHLYHAWFMHEHLLSEWAGATGWSQYQFAGYPAFVLYAPGPYLLIGSLVSVGLPLQVAYNVVLAGTWLGLPLMTYGFLRAHDLPRAESAFAAIFVLCDSGAYNEGGWVQVIEQGVWTGTLALVFCISVLIGLRRLFQHPSPFALACVSALVSASLIVHPVALLILGPAAGLYVLVMSKSWADVKRAACAGLLGVGCAAWWLWPMFSLRDDLIPHGQEWLSYAEVADRLLDGNLFTNSSIWLYVAGSIGMACSWRTNRRFYLFGVLSVVSFLLLASSDSWEFLGLTTSPFYEQMNFHRWVAPARVIWWCFAGAAIGYLARQLSWRRVRHVPIRSSLLLFLTVLLIQPLMPAALNALQAPSNRLGPVTDLDYHTDLMEVLTYLKGVNSRGPVGRVMVREPRNLHCAQWLPIISGKAIAHPSGKPTFHFRRRFYHHDTDVLRAQGVEWILTCNSSPQVSGAVQLFKRGIVSLWSLPKPDSSPVRVRGHGVARIARWEQQRVVVDVEKADGPVQITVPVAVHSRWHATMNGQPLHIEHGKIHPSAVPFFLSATVTKPGTLEFQYRPDRSQSVGLFFSVVSILLLIIIVAFDWGRKRNTSPYS